MGRMGVVEQRGMSQHGNAKPQREQAEPNNYRNSRQPCLAEGTTGTHRISRGGFRAVVASRTAALGHFGGDTGRRSWADIGRDARLRLTPNAHDVLLRYFTITGKDQTTSPKPTSKTVVVGLPCRPRDACAFALADCWDRLQRKSRRRRRVTVQPTKCRVCGVSA